MQVQNIRIVLHMWKSHMYLYILQHFSLKGLASFSCESWACSICVALSES